VVKGKKKVEEGRNNGGKNEERSGKTHRGPEKDKKKHRKKNGKRENGKKRGLVTLQIKKEELPSLIRISTPGKVRKKKTEARAKEDESYTWGEAFP